MLGGVDIVASFITANEQSESNPDCNLYSYIAVCASSKIMSPEFKSTVAGFNCLCGGRKKSPRTAFLVQLSILSGISGSSSVIRCIRSIEYRLSRW